MNPLGIITTHGGLGPPRSRPKTILGIHAAVVHMLRLLKLIENTFPPVIGSNTLPFRIKQFRSSLFVGQGRTQLPEGVYTSRYYYITTTKPVAPDIELPG